MTSDEEELAAARAETSNKQAQSMGLRDTEEYASLQSLSWVLAAGKLAKAQEIERRLLRSARERHTEKSLMYASVMDHIGLQRLRASSYSEAFKLMDAALILRQKLYDYKATATSHDSLGQLEYARGNYREAERLLNRALAARVKLLGEEHSATARTMRSLGCVYRCLGRPDDAIKLFIRSSEIIKKRYGAESLPMASALVLLARHWRRDGKKYKLSCRLCRKVLIIRDAKLGPHHPATAVALGECAAAHRARALGSAEYREEGMLVATRFLERSLTIKKRLYGTRSLRLAKTLSNLGYLYRELGKHVLAMEAFAKVHSLCEDRLGAEHPRTILALSSKAAAIAINSFVSEKKTDEDSSEEESSQSDDEGSDKPRGRRKKKRAEAKKTKKKKKKKKGKQRTPVDPMAERAKAKKLLLKALNLSMEKLGRDHPITGKCFRNYVFTKTEEDVTKNRFTLQRKDDVEEEALGNYLYPWEVCVIAVKKAAWSCLTCAFLRNSKSSAEGPAASNKAHRGRDSIRHSRSGSFFSRLVRKGRGQYLQTLAEEKRESDMMVRSGQAEGESKYVSADTDPATGVEGEAKTSDPLNLAENYSKLIVGHMDFKTNPNQTQKERPPGWNSGMVAPGNKDAADQCDRKGQGGRAGRRPGSSRSVGEWYGTDSSGLWGEEEGEKRRCRCSRPKRELGRQHLRRGLGRQHLRRGLGHGRAVRGRGGRKRRELRRGGTF